MKLKKIQAVLLSLSVLALMSGTIGETLSYETAKSELLVTSFQVSENIPPTEATAVEEIPEETQQPSVEDGEPGAEQSEEEQSEQEKTESEAGESEVEATESEQLETDDTNLIDSLEDNLNPEEAESAAGQDGAVESNE